MRNVDSLGSAEAVESTAAPKGSDHVSASPQSSSNTGGSASGDPFIEGSAGRAAGQNLASVQRASRDINTAASTSQLDGEFTFVVSKDGEFDQRLTQQACSL
jgi:hypothetical protein